MSVNASMSGFPEFDTAGRIVEDYVLRTVSEVFELHGFARIETRALEPLEELQRKGEIAKEVYVVSRLHAQEEEDAKIGLHFDLTVPFARYVTERRGQLNFPFKRYQIQKVWRGERPQEGRFREFTQADIDVVALDELPQHFEREIPLVMAEVFNRLPMPEVEIHVNSRKLLQGAGEHLGIDDILPVLQTIDKLPKIGADAVGELLGEQGLSASQIELLLKLTSLQARTPQELAAAHGLGIDSPLFLEGLADVEALLAGAKTTGKATIVADLSIARGLDYYTGMVYETFIPSAASLGSICSGGRYDSLISDSRHAYPGVGMSIGVTRLVSQMIARGWAVATRSVPTAVLVAVDSEETRSESEAIAAIFRARGISCEVSPQASKYGKQIRYADRRGIPFVWFSGTNEVKDIRSGEQVSADPNSWTPPEADVRPQVVAGE